MTGSACASTWTVDALREALSAYQRRHAPWLYACDLLPDDGRPWEQQVWDLLRDARDEDGEPLVVPCEKPYGLCQESHRGALRHAEDLLAALHRVDPRDAPGLFEEMVVKDLAYNVFDPDGREREVGEGLRRLLVPGRWWSSWERHEGWSSWAQITWHTMDAALVGRGEGWLVVVLRWGED